MKTKVKEKNTIVKNINNLLTTSISTTIVEYKNISSIELKYLRQNLNKHKLQAKILKNTLAKKAILNTQNKSLIKDIHGQILFVFSTKEINLPIIILNDFKKKNKHLKIKAICLYGKIFSENKINYIINLPNKETAILTLLTKLKLPLKSLTHTLNIPCLNLITLLKFKTKTN